MNELHRFQVGPWRVDAATGEIRNPEGEVHRLQPKVMAVLQCLAAAGGRVVSRQELVDCAWDGRPTSDEPLNRCVAEMRSAFGDDSRNPKYFRTVPKRGYQLLAPVVEIDRECRNDRSSPRRTRGWLNFFGMAVIISIAWGGSVALPKPRAEGEPMILVLPLVSAGSETGLLADALTEELLHALAQSSGMLVFSGATTFSLQSSAKAPLDVARGLDARLMLEGTVRLIEDRLRMTVQLIDVRSGLHVFSREFDYPVEEAGQVAVKLARAVASQVNESLGTHRADQGVERLSFARFRDYIEAKRLIRIPEQLRQLDAIERLERVIEEYPDFAAAHAHLAASLILRYEWEGFDPEMLDRADAALRRALELEKDNPLATSLLGIRSGDLVVRESYLRRAVELDPANPDLIRNLALFLEHAGYLEEARFLFRRLFRQDPLNSGYAHTLARLNCSMRLFRRCGAGLEHTKTLEWPGRPLEAFHYYLAVNDKDAAIALLQDYVKHSTTVSDEDIRIIVSAHFDARLRDDANERVARIEASLPGDYKFWPSLFRALIGEPEASVNALIGHDKAPWENRSVLHLWSDTFAEVRRSPGFSKVAEYYGFITLWESSGPAYHCRTVDTRTRQVKCR